MLGPNLLQAVTSSMVDFEPFLRPLVLSTGYPMKLLRSGMAIALRITIITGLIRTAMMLLLSSSSESLVLSLNSIGNVTI